jgi:hypothetical protein
MNALYPREAESTLVLHDFSDPSAWELAGGALETSP